MQPIGSRASIQESGEPYDSDDREGLSSWKFFILEEQVANSST